MYSPVRVVSGLHHGSGYLNAYLLLSILDLVFLQSLIDIDNWPPTLVFVSDLWK